MLEKKKRERIIALVNKEVVPAIGCTEPMAVALCTAQAATTLGKRPERIEVLLSPNMLKNAMGVGIPGTGMIGLPIAVSSSESQSMNSRFSRILLLIPWSWANSIFRMLTSTSS